ncbi:MAG: OmpA family protein [Prolixibacteraceae bacterium]
MKTVHKILVLASVVILSSCVSQKQFTGVQDKLKECNNELEQTRMQLEAANTELKSANELLKEKNEDLSGQLEDALYKLNVQIQKVDALERRLEDAQRQLEALKSGSTDEIENLMAELQTARENLNKREDKLREAEDALEERNERLIELQNILARKEQAVEELKNKVMNALVGFTDKGLTVHEKNGKVYVSLEEKLLFQSGRWQVDPRGQEAIRRLGQVLAENPDINIMVEGHTDNVPMSGSGAVKDNWDLSVMRATAVTKILTQNEAIDPARIIAAGRSKYVPIASNETAEGRQMNRRTEIILTPKLDELLEIIEMN